MLWKRRTTTTVQKEKDWYVYVYFFHRLFNNFFQCIPFIQRRILECLSSFSFCLCCTFIKSLSKLSFLTIYLSIYYYRKREGEVISWLDQKFFYILKKFSRDIFKYFFCRLTCLFFYISLRNDYAKKSWRPFENYIPTFVLRLINKRPSNRFFFSKFQ